MNTSTTTRMLLVLFSLSLVITSTNAQFWEPTPGPWGGEILALETTHSGDFLAGVLGAGLYRSTNDGVTWSAATFPLVQGSILAVARKPGDSLILAGTPNYTYRSTDDGLTWAIGAGNPAPERVVGFVYQVSSGCWYAATGWMGVFRSTDDGLNWSQVNTGLSSLSMSSVGLDETGNVLLAGSLYNGVYRSTNNGASWIETHSGLNDLQTTDLHRSATACFVSTYNGIYKTSSASWNWSKVTDPGISTFSLYSDSLTSEIFAGTMPGLLRSTDDGTTWSPYGAGFPLQMYAVRALTRSPHGTMLAGLPGPGVYRSSDGGGHWTKSTAGILAQSIGTLVADSLGNIYAGTEHGMLFRSPDNGATWDSLYNISCPVRKVLFNGQKVYFSTWGTGVRMSTDGGNSFSVSSISEPIGVLINAFALNPSSGALFVGLNNGVYRTTDDGTVWEKINNGLTDSSVTALFVTSAGKLFCGCGPGLIFTSPDNGDHWVKADSGVAGGGYIWCFAEMMNSVYVGTELGVSCTTDDGHYWVETGLSSSTILALATAKNGHLFACTFQGPYRSKDGGAVWERLEDGFVGNSARAFAVNTDGYAFVSTDGNGIYRSVLKVVSVEPRAGSNPMVFKLEQNYPNPFNPSTTITYTVGVTSGRGQVANVRLAVYDLLGREVAVLVNELKAPGTYQVSFSARGGSPPDRWRAGASGGDAGGLASGVYIYRLKAGSLAESRKMILLR